jgi:hypothetical protein
MPVVEELNNLCRSIREGAGVEEIYLQSKEILNRNKERKVPHLQLFSGRGK